MVWSEDLGTLASMIDAELVYLGDLISHEVSIESELGKAFKSIMEHGNLVSPELVSSLLIKRFFNDSSNKILAHFPRTYSHAEYLSQLLISNNINLDAVLAIDLDRQSLNKKLLNQFHCSNDYSHPNIETKEVNPICTVCNKPLFNTYDLSNPALINTIESYYEKADGNLSAAKLISRVSRANFIHFSTPEDVKRKLYEL